MEVYIHSNISFFIGDTNNHKSVKIHLFGFGIDADLTFFFYPNNYLDE